ncbi:MAG: DUF559 domain-containing protein [Lachnospiraceae bacterium]|nr:DUF559 domain-containing protein [Lachnospiraceae bacterium]
MKTDPNLLDYSRALRKNMTQEKKKLWYTFLRSYAIPFRKQFVKDNYILDFYCSKASLAIEIDGGQHFSEEDLEYDKKRTENLQLKNIEVLRFTNTDIQIRFKAVCEKIDETVKRRI